MTRPGERIRSIASRLFRPETMERVFDPIVADLQCEYREALARGTLWRARLGLVRSYLGLARALICLGLRHLCDPRVSNPDGDVARTWIVSVLAFAVLTLALVIPPLMSWPWRRDPGFAALLSVTLVPQALPVSLPAGLCVGVLWGMRGKAATWRRLSTTLALAIAVTVVVWAVLEWMMPGANQAFREMAATRLTGRVVTLEPGLSELGLSRLGQRSDPAAVEQYHVLWALCFAPIPLSLLASALAGGVRRAPPAIALAIAVSISYMQCIWSLHAMSSRLPMTPFVQAWVPNTVFLLAACALLARSRRRAI